MANKLTLETLAPGHLVYIKQRDAYVNQTNYVGIGKVVRTTATQVLVRNQNNNVCRYRKSDGKAVGCVNPFDYYFISING